MGALSNQLLVVTILLYVFAMLAYAVEYAFGARPSLAPARELVAAGAGAGPVVEEPPPSPSLGRVPARVGLAGSNARSAGKRWLGWLRHRAGVVLTVAGLAFHAATLVTRGFAAHRVPWGNMYEFVLAGSLVGMAVWMAVVVRRPHLRHLGLFAALAVALLLGLDGMVLYTPAGPLVPALNSYWLLIHVTAASVASGILLVGFLGAALHLVRLGYDGGKRRFPYGLGWRLPSVDTLERLTFRVHAFAFPIWTFAIICGAIWAEAAWGRYWGWDPKETWSFVAWVSYAAYLHARSTPSVSRRVTSWLAVAGWAAMIVNLVGVNIFASSFHSYSGLN
jgi:cytochrome c-type biogenesis protein CcsB